MTAQRPAAFLAAAAVSLWLLAEYRVIGGFGLLRSDAGAAVALIVVPALVGAAVRQWWLVMVPAVSLVVAVAIEAFGTVGTQGEPLPPISGALMGAMLFACPSAAAGVAVGKLLTRAMHHLRDREARPFVAPSGGDRQAPSP